MSPYTLRVYSVLQTASRLPTRSHRIRDATDPSAKLARLLTIFANYQQLNSHRPSDSAQRPRRDDGNFAKHEAKFNLVLFTSNNVLTITVLVMKEHTLNNTTSGDRKRATTKFTVRRHLKPRRLEATRIHSITFLKWKL